PRGLVQRRRGELDQERVAGSTARRAGALLAKAPDAVAPSERVKRQKEVAAIGHEFDGAQHELDFTFARVKRQRDADPPRLDAELAAGDLRPIKRASFVVDAEQTVFVGAGARAAGAVLNAEKVIEQRRYEIVMEAANVERQDGKPRQVGRTVQLDSR